MLAVLCLAFAAAPPMPSWRAAQAGTVWVRANGSQGTGWILDARRRLLVTAAHVVAEQDAVEAVFPAAGATRAAVLEHLPAMRKHGLAVRGKVLRRDDKLDLAIIELEPLPPGAAALRLATAAPAVGDRLRLVGNRYDVDVLWAHGVGGLRGTRRLREGYPTAGRTYGTGARLLQTAIPINEGDSGGPLLDAAGDVVGVAAAVAWESAGGGLFVSLEDVRAFLGEAPPSKAGAGAARRAMRATVLIQHPGRPAFAGVLLDAERGLVATMAEAVAREKAVPVAFLHEPTTERAWYAGNAALLRRKGLLVQGTVAGIDERAGLAMLSVGKVPAGHEALALGGDVSPGDALDVVSHPAKMDAHWLHAAASVRQRGPVRLRGDEGPASECLILQAPLLAGDAGGPVCDGAGRLVGILTGKVGPQQQVAYALPASALRRLLEAHTPTDGLAWAERLLEAREWGRARAVFARLEGPAARAGTARAWREEGYVDRALGLLAGDHPAVLRERASCWLERGEPGRALRDAAQFPALRARALARLGRPGALEDADDAVWHDPRSALAALARAEARLARGDEAAALADAEQALRLDDRFGEACRLRGDLRWRKADTAGALADYARALEERPWDAAALWGRGKARAARGDDGGLADLDEAVLRLPALAPLRLDRGGERLRRGRWRSAVADLAAAARLEPRLLPQVLERIERTGDDVADPEAATEAVRAWQPGLVGKDWPAARRKVAALRAKLADN